MRFLEVCPKCKSDLIIDFGKNRHAGHEDEPADFDGKGGTLAHASGPPV